MHMVVYPKPEQKMELKRITPELARQWLVQSNNNQSNFRKINDQRMQKFIALIRRCGWQNNGSSFKFDTNGDMIDGQHRASVIVALGITVWAWVLTGMEPEANAQLDQGGAAGVLRSTTQYLQRIGKPYYTHLASAVYYLNAYRRGHFDWPQNSKGTMQEDIALMNENPELERSVALVAPCVFGLVGPIATIHYVACQNGHKDTADAFVDKLLNGLELKENDPIRRFRDRMIADRGAKAHLPAREKIALLVISWNAWIAGKEVKSLAWHSVGPKEQAFPTIEMPSPEQE